MSLTCHADVHRALRAALVTAVTGFINPVTGVALEGRDFNPAVGVPWVRESCKWGRERLASLPARRGITRLDGLYLIDLFFPDGSGDATIDACVGLVRATYFGGTTLSYNGQLVNIQGVSRAGASVDAGFIQTPCSVPFYAYDVNPA